MIERPIRLRVTGRLLAPDQWKYFVFLVLTVVVFVVMRNIVRSRTGRSLVAVRDNETAAEVSGVHVARVKILTFGVSSAMAGIGGAGVRPQQRPDQPVELHDRGVDLLPDRGGGRRGRQRDQPGHRCGRLRPVHRRPVAGAARAVQAATPVILGVLLILLMLFSPRAGSWGWRTSAAKRAASGRAATAAAAPGDTV